MPGILQNPCRNSWGKQKGLPCCETAYCNISKCVTLKRALARWIVRWICQVLDSGSNCADSTVLHVMSVGRCGGKRRKKGLHFAPDKWCTLAWEKGKERWKMEIYITESFSHTRLFPFLPSFVTKTCSFLLLSMPCWYFSRDPWQILSWMDDLNEVS